jgi:Zn-dependent protease
MDWIELLRNFVGFFVILLFSLCFHEYAHGLMAKIKGDLTAERMGRLTLNPLPHLDLTGTVILPGITVILNSMGASLPFFGWAKPVPVNTRHLKNPRQDLFWIALAGPLSNIFLAVLGTLLLSFFHKTLITSAYYKALTALSAQFIVTNLFLAFFNLIPLNPLDGGKILARFLPPSLALKLEQYEAMTGMILMFLILMGALKYLAIPVFITFKWLLMVSEYGLF